MPPAKLDKHHVSFCFDKSRVMFSVPSTTTLAQLKETFLSALPHLIAGPSEETSLPGLDAEDLAAMGLPPPSSAPAAASSYLSRIESTSDFVLWQARRGVDMAAGPQAGTDGSDILGWSSLEGDVNHPDFSARTDQQGSREKSLKRMIKDMSQPVWGRWVEVFVSFKQDDGEFSEPTVDLPKLDEDEA